MLSKENLSIYKIASKDQSRPIIAGVLFKKIKEGSLWKIVLAATDGYVLTQKKVEVEFEPSFDSMVIPRQTVESVCKLLDKKRRVLLSENQFKIMRIDQIPGGILERTVTIGDKPVGDYPEYEALIPATESKVAESNLNPTYIKDIASQANNFAVSVEMFDGNSPVLFKSSDENTEVLSLIMPLKK